MKPILDYVKLNNETQKGLNEEVLECLNTHRMQTLPFRDVNR